MARNQYREYYLQLINSRTMSPIDDDTGVYNVYTVSTPTEATIYSDTNGTSQANPGTISNGIIRFYTASSVLSVDVSILTASGHAIFVEALTPSQHRILVNPDEWKNQKLVIGMTLPGTSATLVDTGFDLPDCRACSCRKQCSNRSGGQIFYKTKQPCGRCIYAIKKPIRIGRSTKINICISRYCGNVQICFPCQRCCRKIKTSINQCC